MASSEVPAQDSSESWTENDAYQLYRYMDTEQPNFRSSRTNDPFMLARDLQQTIDSTEDKHMRLIMGEAGEDILNNKVAPQQLTYRHLAIMTERLIILSGHDDGNFDEHISRTLVTGLFGQFKFETSTQPYADKDFLAVRLVKPDFLVAQSKKVALELFDASKRLVSVASSDELAIPVDAIRGQAYNPTSLFS